jgi:hypothetical protein
MSNNAKKQYENLEKEFEEIFRDTPKRIETLVEPILLNLEEIGLKVNPDPYVPSESVNEAFGYRKRREMYKLIERTAEENIRWSSFVQVNYPFKKNLNPVSLVSSKKSEAVHKELKVLHWNANGITGKVDKIEDLIREHKPEVFSINEIKTNKTTENYLYQIAKLGYNVFFKSRKKISNKENNSGIIEGHSLGSESEREDSNGGGVALFIKDNITCWPIDVPVAYKDFEIVGAQIKSGNKFISIFSWYLPPKEDACEEVLSYIESHQDFILIGDLNMHLRKLGAKKQLAKDRKFEEFLQAYKGVVLNKPNIPTFFFHQCGALVSSSTIDYIIASESLANSAGDFETWYISPVFNKDLSYFHVPISCKINIEIKKRKERKSFISSFLYDKANWREFAGLIDAALIDEWDYDDVALMEEKIENSIKGAAAQCIPKSKEKLNRDHNFPEPIKEVLKSRNYWRSEYKKNPNGIAADQYRLKEELASDMIAQFKRAQWARFLKEQGPHPLSSVPFWRRVNRLRENKRKKNIGALLINNKVVTDDKEKAEAFAAELEKKFTLDSNENFNDQTKILIENFIETGSLASSYSHTAKRAIPFDYREFSNAISDLNSKTSLDPYGLTNKMLKHLGYVAKLRIMEFFNRCLTQGVVPKKWKASVVSMLHKNGQDEKSVSSYRPISMTSCLARLFERMILSRLLSHIKNNNILIKNQSGFRKARQTKDNILYLIQMAQEGFNKGEKTTAIFFDVQAAFDKVWHSGLIYKLFLLRVPFYIIMIIKDFLTGRTFVVKIEGKVSSVRVVMCGVPQGGVLSPTMFSLYINDIPVVENDDEMAMLFADDLAYAVRYCYKKNGKIIENSKSLAEKKANAYLRRLEAWMGEWRLNLAPKKCSQTTFSKARETNDDRLNLSLYNQPIPSEDAPKFLGIVFDKRLSFINHLDSIKKKTNDRLNLLKVLSYDANWRLNEKLLLSMYKVLVRSIIDYASVTSIAMTNDVRDQLEVLQNNALRIIFKIKRTDHISIETLLDRAGISTIRDRHNQLLLNYYEKAIVSGNELMKTLFTNYNKFKRRGFALEGSAVREDESVDLDHLAKIRDYNKMLLSKDEMYPTTLCCAPVIIRSMILDAFDNRVVGSRNGFT